MEVILKIYSFNFFLINLIHTEIEFNGRDFGFFRGGIMVTPSTINKETLGFTLQRIIRCGISTVDPYRFDIFVRNSVLRFNRNTYNIFTRNCRHYSEYLLTELTANDSEEGKKTIFSSRHKTDFSDLCP